MRSERITIQYQLHCHTPLHCGTGLRHGLIHRSVVRDATGFVFIPGSTLKGVLRDHATHLAQLLGLAAYPPHDTEKALQEFAPQSDMITLIFGSRFHPGTLFFDDAPLCNEDREFFQAPQEADVFPVPQTQARTRVSLSRLTGTAQRKLLFSTEYGVPEMRFNGKIAGVLRGIPLIDAPATYSLILLLAALHVLEAIGGDKSLGAGRVTCRVTQLIVDSQEKHPAEYLDLLPQFEYYELAAEEEAR